MFVSTTSHNDGRSKTARAEESKARNARHHGRVVDSLSVAAEKAGEANTVNVEFEEKQMEYMARNHERFERLTERTQEENEAAKARQQERDADRDARNEREEAKRAARVRRKCVGC